MDTEKGKKKKERGVENEIKAGLTQRKDSVEGATNLEPPSTNLTDRLASHICSLCLIFLSPTYYSLL